MSDEAEKNSAARDIQSQLDRRRNPIERRLWDLENRADRIEESLEQGAGVMTSLADQIAENTRVTTENNLKHDAMAGDIAELLAIFKTLKAAGKLGKWIGEGVKWIAAVLIAGAVIVYILKTGDVPKK